MSPRKKTAQQILADVAATLASSLNADDMLTTVAGQIGEAMDVWSCHLWDYDDERRTLTCVACWAKETTPELPDSVGTVEAVDGRPDMKRLIEGRRMAEIHADDPGLDQEKRATLEKSGTTCALDVPLAHGDRVIGVLGLVERREGRRFTETEKTLAGQLALQASVAIQNARLCTALQQRAGSDALTGLYNHGYFHQRLAQEVARVRRYKLPLALLMADIDEFTSFNDEFGHLTGDAALRVVSSVLLTGVRRHVDVVARFGGEAFAVLLPNTTLIDDGDMGVLSAQIGGFGEDKPATGGALAVAERLREQVESRTGEAPRGLPRKLTVSIGVAEFVPAMVHGDDLIERADRALHRAKLTGKNRVAIWE